MAIQELDMNIRHHSGKSNRVADALSRNPVPVADILQVEVKGGNTPSSAECESDIRRLQRCDGELSGDP